MVAQKAPESPTEQAAALSTSWDSRFAWNTSAPAFVPQGGQLYDFNASPWHPGPAQPRTCDPGAAVQTSSLRRARWLPGRGQEQGQRPQAAARLAAAPAYGPRPSRGGEGPQLPQHARPRGRPRQPRGRGGSAEAAAGPREDCFGRQARAIPPARDGPPLPPGIWRAQCPRGRAARLLRRGGEGYDAAAAAPAAAAGPAPAAGRSAREAQPDSEELFYHVTCKNTFIEVTAEPAVAAGSRPQSAPPPLRARWLGTQAGGAIPLGAVARQVRAPDGQKTLGEVQASARPGGGSPGDLELGRRRAERLGAMALAATASAGRGPAPRAGRAGLAAARAAPRRLSAPSPPRAGRRRPARVAAPSWAEGERVALARLDEDRRVHADFLSALPSESSRSGRATPLPGSSPGLGAPLAGGVKPPTMGAVGGLAAAALCRGMSDASGEEWVDGAEDEGGPCAKIQSSCAMMSIGLVLFPLSLYMVGWNENNYVCEKTRILFAGDNAEELGCDSRGVSNQFGYFSCGLDPASFRPWTAEDFLLDKGGDNAFYAANSKALNSVQFSALSARMVAEVRQCKKECTTKTVKVNGKNTKTPKCTYTLVWSDKVLDVITGPEGGPPGPPSDARKSCPGLKRYQGSAHVPSAISDKLGQQTQFSEEVRTQEVNEAKAFKLNADLVRMVLPTEEAHAAIYMPAAAQGGPQALDCSAVESLVGCVRLRFEKSTATSVSVFTHVVADGETEAQRMPSAWGCPGKPWQALQEGILSKDAAVQALKDANAAQVILLRVGFVVLAWVSVYCVLSPISAIAELFGGLANMIPFVGGYLEDFIEGVVDAVLCAISCSVGLSCSFFVMGVVWLFMRPLYGAGMLLVCAALCACACLVRQRAGAPRKRQAREVSAGGTCLEMQPSPPPAVAAAAVPMAAQPMAQPMVGPAMNSSYAPPAMAVQPLAQPVLGQPVVGQPMMAAPMAVAQPPVAQAVVVPPPAMMQVACPANVGPGQAIFVLAPDGRQLQVTVPAGVSPGMQFQVQV
ncbi:unnamed protein product [Prorocentrum cordatum]|uniref:Uncharacterized protein n=1 Tax=Prorocentrum cordatum TaxID=2364126 RepID=A0ABN9X3T1_9DINO|nr:unnamed protein product [Polarella glacialis]